MGDDEGDEGLMSTIEDAPYRVVDAQWQGWFWTGDGYRADSGHERGLPVDGVDLAWLETHRGPVRPVVAPSASTTALVLDALREAGPLAVGTLAGAFAVVYVELLTEIWKVKVPDWPSPDQDEAMAAFTAGRPGSWESALLREVVWFGRDINADPTRYAPGPRDTLAGLVRSWITGPGPYVELAENAAAWVSTIADEHGPDGWAHVADTRLQPGTSAADMPDHHTCHRLLYSLSAHA